MSDGVRDLLAALLEASAPFLIFSEWGDLHAEGPPSSSRQRAIEIGSGVRSACSTYSMGTAANSLQTFVNRGVRSKCADLMSAHR